MEISKGLLDLWRKGNDSGKGFAIGASDMTPAEAAVDRGYEIEEEDSQGNIVARNDVSHIVVRDVYGPWAVEVQKKEGGQWIIEEDVF